MTLWLYCAALHTVGLDYTQWILFHFHADLQSVVTLKIHTHTPTLQIHTHTPTLQIHTHTPTHTPMGLGQNLLGPVARVVSRKCSRARCFFVIRTVFKVCSHCDVYGAHSPGGYSAQELGFVQGLCVTWGSFCTRLAWWWKMENLVFWLKKVIKFAKELCGVAAWGQLSWIVWNCNNYLILILQWKIYTPYRCIVCARCVFPQGF